MSFLGILGLNWCKPQLGMQFTWFMDQAEQNCILFVQIAYVNLASMLFYMIEYYELQNITSYIIVVHPSC